MTTYQTTFVLLSDHHNHHHHHQYWPFHNINIQCTLLRSWYKNSKGINFILWPVNLLQYWWMTRVPDLLNDFKLTFDKAYYDLWKFWQGVLWPVKIHTSNLSRLCNCLAAEKCTAVGVVMAVCYVLTQPAVEEVWQAPELIVLDKVLRIWTSLRVMKAQQAGRKKGGGRFREAKMRVGLVGRRNCLVLVSCWW